MNISVIIPTFNEEENIEACISHLLAATANNDVQIIVSDGGSRDNTVEIAQKVGATVITSPIKGRAGQMNYAINFATAPVYYFVHADAKPPSTFLADIENAIQKKYNCGCYRSCFDSKQLLLKLNAFFTRFDVLFCRGGDQTIFVTKQLFDEVGGFNNEMLIMEDYDFLAKIRKKGSFKLIPKSTLFSARKYTENSWLTVQKANLKVVRMYKKGASQQDMIDTYKRMLNYRKNAF